MGGMSGSFGTERRRLLKGVLYASLGAALGGRGAIPSAHAAPRRFVLGTTGGRWHDGTKKIFFEDSGFRTRQDLEVIYDIQTDSGLNTKILANCAKPIYDCVQSVESNAAKAFVSGCLSDYDPAKVPNLADVPRAYTLGRYYASCISLLNGLVYNTKHVARPTGWQDLMNPRYKGKVGIPMFGWIGQHFLHAINKALGGNEDNIDPGIRAAADIVGKNEAVIIQGSNPGDLAFQREEVWIMPFWNGRMLNLRKAGLPVEIFYQPHFLHVGTGYLVPKGVSNPALSNELVNLTLDPGVQLEMVKFFGYAPTNRRVKIPPDLAEVVLPPYAVDRAAEIDWIKVMQHADRDLERWNKEVLRG